MEYFNEYMDKLEMIQIEQQITENTIIMETMRLKGYKEEDYADIVWEVSILESEKETIKNRSGLFKKMKDLANKNKRLLSKYKEDALNNNPIGLEVEVHINDMSKPARMFKSYSNDLKKILKEYDKTNNLSDFKSKCKNLQIKYYSEEHVDDIEKESVKATKTKKITKQDVKEAVKFLEDFDKNLKKVEARRNKYREDGINYAQKYDNKYVKKVATLSFYLSDTVFYELHLLNNKLADSRKIVQMAAKHNPRNIKESIEDLSLLEGIIDIEDYIESIE